jgi:hypothetical protein
VELGGMQAAPLAHLVSAGDMLYSRRVLNTPLTSASTSCVALYEMVPQPFSSPAARAHAGGGGVGL